LFISREGEIRCLRFISSQFLNSNGTHEIYRIISEVSIEHVNRNHIVICYNCVCEKSIAILKHIHWHFNLPYQKRTLSAFFHVLCRLCPITSIQTEFMFWFRKAVKLYPQSPSCFCIRAGGYGI
jgi:hypothetical protein